MSRVPNESQLAAGELGAALAPILDKVKTYILNPVIGLMFAIAFVVFLWGIFQFIKNAAEPEERQVGARHIMYGFVGMFIMVAAYAIIRIITNTIGVDYPTSLGR